MKLNKFLTAAISAVLISVILASCTARKSEESDYMGSIASSDSAQTDAPENKSGITSPNSFTAVTLDGGEYTADDFSEADVTVINIWSTTCGPCIREMPEIAEYEKTLP